MCIRDRMDGNISAIDADLSYFSNLNLRLWYAGDGGDILIAQSVSEYNNVEHLFLELSQSGDYRLEVVFEDMVYGDISEESYGIAWNLSAIPEPSHCAALLGAVAIMFCIFRRRV